MERDEIYMQRCLQLAKNGLGHTFPNPLVGSVIVWQNKIIGEGWHQKAGTAHAEVHAINSVQHPERLSEATLYVNLEPCSHFGKTPPCCDLIIKKRIKRVVVGTVDPNPEVAGRGIKRMRDAGIAVTVGCSKSACRILNRRFFTFHEHQRPYVILKWAQTADGFISPEQQKQGQPRWITSPASTQLVHKWRSEEAAILIGKTTLMKDNPQLNTRLWKGSSPVRVVIDRYLESHQQHPEAHFFDQSVKTIVFCEHPPENKPNLFFEKLDFNRETSAQILSRLYEHQLQSLIVEGGQLTLQHFIDFECWDEARVFTGNIYFEAGIYAPLFQGKPVETRRIETDTYHLYLHKDNLTTA